MNVSLQILFSQPFCLVGFFFIPYLMSRTQARGRGRRSIERLGRRKEEEKKFLASGYSVTEKLLRMKETGKRGKARQGRKHSKNFEQSSTTLITVTENVKTFSLTWEKKVPQKRHIRLPKAKTFFSEVPRSFSTKKPFTSSDPLTSRFHVASGGGQGSKLKKALLRMKSLPPKKKNHLQITPHSFQASFSSAREDFQRWEKAAAQKRRPCKKRLLAAIFPQGAPGKKRAKMV